MPSIPSGGLGVGSARSGWRTHRSWRMRRRGCRMWTRYTFGHVPCACARVTRTLVLRRPRRAACRLAGEARERCAMGRDATAVRAPPRAAIESVGPGGAAGALARCRRVWPPAACLADVIVRRRPHFSPPSLPDGVALTGCVPVFFWLGLADAGDAHHAACPTLCRRIPDAPADRDAGAGWLALARVRRWRSWHCSSAACPDAKRSIDDTPAQGVGKIA